MIPKASFVSCGGQHTLVLAQGVVFSFGCGRDGQLGHGATASEWRPRAVETLLHATDPIIQIAAGGGHSVALARSGVAYTWGHAEEGQLGVGQCRDGMFILNLGRHRSNIKFLKNERRNEKEREWKRHCRA